jgi:hypothetical protein
MRMSRFSAYAGATCFVIGGFCTSLQAMGYVNWEYISTINDVLNFLGFRDKGPAERVVERPLTWFMSQIENHIPASVSGALQVAWQSSGAVVSGMAVREAGMAAWGLAKAGAAFMTSAGWRAVTSAMGRL